LRIHNIETKGAAMRTAVHIVLGFLVLFAFLSCNGNTETQEVSAEVLAHYIEYSAYTDPGEYAYLYEELPSSHEDLCDIIEATLVHPVEIRIKEIEVPLERAYEDTVHKSVAEMLARLVKHNPDGLVPDRRFEEKIYVACVHHALLYASIMKHREVPARLRAGFAPYIGERLGIEGLHTGHAVTEVWDEEKGRWILIDPDLKMIDFERKRFEFPADVWAAYRSGKIEVGERYRSYRGHGHYALLHMLCLDLRCALNNEVSYWLDPPIIDDLQVSIEDIDPERLAVLDRVAELLKLPEANLAELERLYDQHEYLKPVE
jgi:hypothetical protein